MLWRRVTAAPLPDNVVEAFVGEVVVPDEEVVEAFTLLIRLSLGSTPPCTAAVAAGVLSPPAVPFSEDLLH